MNSVEIKDKKIQLRNRCADIIAKCKAEIREMTEEEAKEFEANKAEIELLNAQLEELKKKLAEYEMPTDEQQVEDEENKEEERNKKNMKKTEFRLLKTIADIANNRSIDKVSEAVINEGKEEMRKAGLSYGGQIQLPVEKRDITVANEGEDVVATDLYSIIEPLRAKSVMVEAGAKFMGNLVGDVQIPVMSAGNVTWENETATAQDAGTAFTSVKLQPKRLTAYIDLSKQFLVQDSKDAEALIRQDLINAIASKLESTILGEGKGSATEPQGLFAEVSGATPTADFKTLCENEAEVENANVNGECVYIMGNKAKAGFRNMPKSSKTNQLVMEAGEIDGTKVFSTSNCGAKNYVYGDFSNLAIGQFGSVDLTVDPYSLAKDGKVRIVINAYFDAKVLRADAFKIGKLA